MTTFQWGKSKALSNRDGVMIENQIQVVICLDCYDWCYSSPMDCRLWMVNHSEEKHPMPFSMKEEMNVYDDKRYD